MRKKMTSHLALVFLFQSYLRIAESAFFPGRIMYGKNEYPELSGRMSVRAAVSKCETDPECAGFTFMGSPELDTERHVGFFRYFMQYYSRHFYLYLAV